MDTLDESGEEGIIEYARKQGLTLSDIRTRIAHNLGMIAIAYNHSSCPEAVKNGYAWPGLRCPVSVALSEDGGEPSLLSEV